jgi:hypothetical protein
VSAEIYEALVVTGNDPLNQGRVKVVIPQVSGAAVSAWALPTNRLAAPPPAAGSTVWVHLDTGDPSKPVYHAGALWSAWTPVPAAWLASGWHAPSAAYRCGPGGRVQWRGAVTTTVSPVPATSLVMTTVGILPVTPVYTPVVLITPAPVVGAVLLDNVLGQLSWVAGSTAFTGTAQLYLNPLTYSTV